MTMRIGLIGCGTMGSAILSGLFRSRLVRARHVFVYDVDRSKSASARTRFKVRTVRSNSDLIRSCEIVLLAVKPQDLPTVAGEIRADAAGKRLTVVSILAGTPVQTLRQRLGSRPAIVRAMPNLGAQVGEAVTAITGSNRSALRAAEKIFSGCGKVIQLPEKHFDIVTAVSGSGPAYFFHLMELLAEMGQKKGLSRTSAQLLAVQTALGAARLAQASSYSPAKLRKMVTSKKGTTEAALKYLAQRGFARIFSSAIERAINRSRELSRR